MACLQIEPLVCGNHETAFTVPKPQRCCEMSKPNNKASQFYNYKTTTTSDVSYRVCALHWDSHYVIQVRRLEFL